jgi:hypothetical protein
MSTNEDKIRLNSYYSLTNISYYNIDDDDDDTNNEDPSKVSDAEPNQQHLNDIGYSSENDRTSSTKNIVRTSRKLKFNVRTSAQRKSFSDHYVHRKHTAAKRVRDYQRFFSRYSHLANSDSEDYVDDDDYIEDDRAESLNSDSGKQYGSTQFGVKQSSTTSGAYDTSSNLSADCHYANFFLSNCDDEKKSDSKRLRFCHHAPSAPFKYF